MITNTIKALAAFYLAILGAQAMAFDLQAHRGGRGLAPENTLAAFANALDLGVTTLELDVGITADDVLVVSHDPYLNPAFTRDAHGRWLAERGPLIRSLTLEQLQRYDVGRINPDSPYAKLFPLQQPRDRQAVPTLASLFQMVKDRGASKVRFNIETKLNPNAPGDTASPEAFVQSLTQLVQSASLTARVTLQSFDWRTLQLAQKQNPSLRTVYLTVQSPNFDNTRTSAWTAGLRLEDHGNSLPRMVKAAGGAAWSPNAGALTADAVKEAQALGLQVIPWTVNSEPDMQRLLDWGVDGLITDYPDRLRSLMRQRGLPLPQGLKAE